MRTLLLQSVKFFLIISCSLLIACTTLNYSPDNDQELKRYELSEQKTSKKNVNPDGQSLIVYPIKTVTAYNSPRIAYRQKQYEIAYYAKNEWVDSPGEMLLPILVNSMESSGMFHSVISASSAAMTELALDAELLQLIHIYNESSSDVHLSMRVQLIDLVKRTVVGTETLNIMEPAPDNNPHGAVLAANKISEKLAMELQTFIKRTLQFP